MLKLDVVELDGRFQVGPADKVAKAQMDSDCGCRWNLVCGQVLRSRHLEERGLDHAEFLQEGLEPAGHATEHHSAAGGRRLVGDVGFIHPLAKSDLRQFTQSYAVHRSSLKQISISADIVRIDFPVLGLER